MSRFQHKSIGLLRNEYSIPAGELIIGNIAAIAAHKDYFTFVDVAEIVLSKNIAATFFIVGDGPDRKEIEQYVHAKKLGHKILFTGFRNDVPQILPEFDILLLLQKQKG
ncbi:MAG: glycosyltransferase family 4 protein [Bacteroidetes bacterium]|nr:glycosyltransferase family 4 protein [Bacteroidota bacterium]